MNKITIILSFILTLFSCNEEIPWTKKMLMERTSFAATEIDTIYISNIVHDLDGARLDFLILPNARVDAIYNNGKTENWKNFNQKENKLQFTIDDEHYVFMREDDLITASIKVTNN